MEGKMMDSMADALLTMSRVFNAPRRAVWAAWTDPEEIAKWMGPNGTTTRVDAWECVPGGAYKIVMSEPDGEHPLRGEFVEVVEARRLAMTWVWEHGVLDGVETLVEIDFRDVDGGTEMTLVHTKLPTPMAVEMHTQGWHGCLDSLQGHIAP